MSDSGGPELVIGLAGAVGVDPTLVASELRRAFETVSYDLCEINLIEKAMALPPWKQVAEPSEFDKRYHWRMTVGNELRLKLRRRDALALAGIAAIESARREYWEHQDEKVGGMSPPVPRCAFVLRSLKTPQEVDTLRRTYGDNLLVIAAYVPKEERIKTLMAKIAHSRGNHDMSKYEDHAKKLVARDEHERGRYFGQNLRDTFPLGDYFIDATTQLGIEEGARRFVELLFGHPFRTPTRDEAGMFQAYGAALKSSAPRQVGAAIATTEGEIVSLGTNEVAKAFGGQYSADDSEEDDHRDQRRLLDVSNVLQQDILRDLVERLRRHRWLSQSISRQSTDALLLEMPKLLKPLETRPKDPPSLGERAGVLNLVEFMRPVHGEMAALVSAARRGIPVGGCVLYVTTFPCHECARLIVCAGISRVVFVEPYPKSKVAEMYDDSIALDPPRAETRRVPFHAFVGTAPPRYSDFFRAPERTDSGSWIRWDDIRERAIPRIGGPAYTYRDAEIARLKTYSDCVRSLKKKGPQPVHNRARI